MSAQALARAQAPAATWPQRVGVERRRKPFGGLIAMAETESVRASAPTIGAEPLVVMRGKWISLRTLVPRDLEYLSAWADDPQLEKMVGSEFLHAYKHQYDKDPSFYEAVLNDPTQVVLMIDAHQGWEHPVGLVRLFNVHVVEGYAYIETIVADQKALKRGFGVHACRLISYYGMDALGLRRIEAKVYEYNALSINTLKRNNCVQEGVLRKAAYQDGRYWDVYVFGILKEELDELRRRDRYL